MGTSLFDQTPSAISHMMGLLSVTPPAAQGANPPAAMTPNVQPSQMPQLAAPAPVQGRLVDRIHNRLEGLLGSVIHPTQPGGLLASDVPDGYEGLVNAREAADAGPNLLQRILHPDELGDIQRGNLDRMLKMKEYASHLSEQNRIEGVRKGLGAAMQGASDPREAAAKGYQYLLQNNDLGGAKEIAIGRGSFLNDQPTKDAQIVHNVMGTGPNAGKPVTAFFDPATHKRISEELETGAPMGPDAIAFRQSALDIARANAQNAADQRNITNADRETRAFNTTNKKLVDSVVPYQNFKNALAEAKAGNPAALSSALINYAATADPNAQLRQGVIQMVANVDKSFRGSFEQAVARLSSGTLPKYLMTDMERLADRVHQTNRDMYEQRRAGAVKRNPALDNYISPSDEMFGMPSTSRGSDSATGATSRPIVVNGKTFHVKN